MSLASMETLNDKMARFERMRTELLDELRSRDPETLTARPLEDKWSVMEIVEHMAVAEREVLMGLPERSALKTYDRTLKNRLMLKVVMFVLGRRIKVKVPSRTMNPKGEADLRRIIEMWDESQKWLTDYVSGCSPEELRKAVFSHPVAGPIDVEQTVDMGMAHLESHRAQIEKLLELHGRKA